MQSGEANLIGGGGCQLGAWFESPISDAAVEDGPCGAARTFGRPTI
jgi:hypothetical protein